MTSRPTHDEPVASGVLDDDFVEAVLEHLDQQERPELDALFKP